MISSAALPNVALRNPPHAGPDRAASCSVPRPMRPASGISDTAAVRNSQGDAGEVTASNHDSGASTSSALSGDERSARTMSSGPRGRLFAELLLILVVG